VQYRHKIGLRGFQVTICGFDRAAGFLRGVAGGADFRLAAFALRDVGVDQHEAATRNGVVADFDDPSIRPGALIGSGSDRPTRMPAPRSARNCVDRADRAPSPRNPATARRGRSFWPYATTLFDYVRRAMPLTAPKSLTDVQVYAVCAYILSLNGIIGADDTMNAETLRAVRMPNRDGFVLFSRSR
jgi:hypothetical protein